MRTIKDRLKEILVLLFYIFLILLVKDLINKQFGKCVKDVVFIFITIELVGLLAGSKLKSAPKSKPVDEMTGEEYELYCAQLLLNNKKVNTVQTTPITADYGADLIATDKNGNTWVFQCKRYKGNVGVKAVQEVCAARKHYNANKAAVITNSKFTKNAKRLAMENDIQLFEMVN
jgi:restriction system protein